MVVVFHEVRPQRGFGGTTGGKGTKETGGAQRGVYLATKLSCLMSVADVASRSILKEHDGDGRTSWPRWQLGRRPARAMKERKRGSSQARVA